jgi:hypothetical protein
MLLYRHSSPSLFNRITGMDRSLFFHKPPEAISGEKYQLKKENQVRMDMSQM